MFVESDLILKPDGSVYHLGLVPADLADTVITVGDPERVPLISRHFEKIELQKSRREFVTHTGFYKGKRLTVISTGIGTDNIEIVMNELDALVNIDLEKRQVKNTHKSLNIIRIGTSGALQKEIPLDSHLISESGLGLDSTLLFYQLEAPEQYETIAQAFQIATDLPFLPYIAQASEKLLVHFGKEMAKGNTLTCSGFYAAQGRSLRYKSLMPHFFQKLQQFYFNDFRISNLEMETSALYAFGKIFGHEMLSLNAIVANRADQKFSSEPEKTVQSLIIKTLDLCVNL